MCSPADCGSLLRTRLSCPPAWWRIAGEAGRSLTGAQWRKSTYSGTSGGECVEVAGLSAPIAVRDSKDSKDPEGPAFTVTPAAFSAFVAAVAASARWVL
ncbi:DUF397 domain-containing protein [Streptomyces sp. NPDC003016]